MARPIRTSALLCILACACLAIAGCSAGEAATRSERAPQSKTLLKDTYITVGGGLSSLDFKDPARFQGASTKSGVSLALGGGYTINPKLAAEVGFQHFGSRDFDGRFGFDGETFTDKGSISAFAVSAAAVGSLPVRENLFVKGRLGPTWWRVSEDEVFDGVPLKHSASGVGLMAGVGAGYHLTPAVEIQANLNHYFGVGAQDETGRSDANIFSLGVSYHLGRR